MLVGRTWVSLIVCVCVCVCVCEAWKELYKTFVLWRPVFEMLSNYWTVGASWLQQVFEAASVHLKTDGSASHGTLVNTPGIDRSHIFDILGREGVQVLLQVSPTWKQNPSELDMPTEEVVQSASCPVRFPGCVACHHWRTLSCILLKLDLALTTASASQIQAHSYAD